MAISAVKGLVSEFYTPEQDGDEAEKTAFEVKPLNGLIAMEVLSEGRTDENGNLHLSAAAMNKALRHGFVGWRHFNDETGKEIKFSVTNFHRVPPMELNNIVNKIINMSQLTGEEIKNS